MFGDQHCNFLCLGTSIAISYVWGPAHQHCNFLCFGDQHCNILCLGTSIAISYVWGPALQFPMFGDQHCNFLCLGTSIAISYVWGPAFAHNYILPDLLTLNVSAYVSTINGNTVDTIDILLWYGWCCKWLKWYRAWAIMVNQE